jgi:hypothetical protein
MVPELGKAACSIMGAYGKSSGTGKLIHLRVNKKKIKNYQSIKILFLFL